jgi:hypothetical protein
MRLADINISDFKNIEEVYTFLDENAYLLERNWDLTDLFVKYRSHTADKREKQLAQWELEGFLFHFKGNHTFSFSYSSGENVGKVHQYPVLDDFQKNAFEYITARALQTNNALVKARYNHLLWKAPKGVKSKLFAQQAAQHYIIAINQYLSLYKQDKDRENFVRILDLFELIVSIAAEIREYHGEVKELSQQLLNAIKIPFYTKHSLLRIMLEYGQIFKADSFSGSLALFEKELTSRKKKSDDFGMVNYYLPTAIRIASKLGEDIRIWHNTIGECYVRLADEETEEDRNWLKLHDYAQAIRSFGQAGNVIRKKEIEQLYFELKPNVKLNNVQINFDDDTVKALEESNNAIKAYASKILAQSPEYIYHFISKGEFFSRKEHVEKAMQNEENSFLNFVTTLTFDINKNISQLSDNSDSNKLFNTYGERVRLVVLPFLHYIIVPGIKEGKLTFENFISFLAKHTWLGKSRFYKDLGGELIEYNWIPVLSPAIVEYFVQMQSCLWSETYKPNFILCIDSLALKFEGLLRDFSESVNVATSAGNKKGIHETNINQILEHEVIKKYFNEDDLLFFSYLFGNEGGLNMRNNIAHCFYDFTDYSNNRMLLLIAALLRVAKYQFTQPKK